MLKNKKEIMENITTIKLLNSTDDYEFQVTHLREEEVVGISYSEYGPRQNLTEIHCSKKEAEQIALAILEVIREPLRKPY